MPLKHQNTKSHKTLKINHLIFSEILCFSDFVARNTFFFFLGSLILGLGTWGFLLPSPASAQQSKIDSLQTLLNSDKEDTNKVNHLNALVKQFISSEPQNALDYARQALKLAEELKWEKGIANSFHSVGYYYYTQADSRIRLTSGSNN